ncbi:hypothetical protein PHYBLDRAFT_63506 [Phycomyces blakesleeanus NRRL 1555(-)]|uniref:SWIM-type domain-containing protein n=1 Tax=Phycomyces blakesleeanus (strain ATCC 8743b / DSM 1359 / FGSC 10004 / NBRC 33097 / NRRL 1555) TaxID=763407 RepID=A0A162WKC7_PHYB8|nr:hypothetical protein PHYBLDRAFT_63506 [Phycomyces blakesleeanus NRRL 1555(-)]OAD68585.1 hypothetical protein PHYBLDRAFT_63506 [Phycomyces blakesleeanus NRRL 1555(-)]|eukprot:XP_018286625.1 hypothetical protein PHYBLDRAFT_63506 [Phycomyces blakesleeanus NRRL 1555(-)]
MSNTIFNLSNVQNALVNSPTEGIRMLPLDVVVKKDTKLCYCEATIFIKQYIKNPEVALICMTNDHTNHVPGNASEIRTLPLPSEAIKIIEDQLKGGSTCRNTRISVLQQIKEWGVGIRKPNYEDIYNRIRKHFAFGFQSPSQMMLMRISQSFCFDATHNISAHNIEILYSLVTQHPDTGKGIAENNAITAALPQTIIHFCKFHVLRAWQHNLDSKVKLDASYTSEQLGKYKYELKTNLKNILIESDEDEFLRKIQEFRLRVQSQQQFLAYFERKWIGTEELLRRWGRPYVANDHQRYLTNNYIESWHNQLKTIYFGHTRIRRLDRLVFILTNNVEFFYDKEVNVSNNLIRNCTCPNFASRQIPCKHAHLLKRFIGLDFAYTVQRENNHLQLQRSLASEHEVAVINEEVENKINAVVVSGRNNSVWLQRIMAQNTTLHHQREDLEQLINVSGIDEAELQVISGLLGEAMNHRHS